MCRLSEKKKSHDYQFAFLADNQGMMLACSEPISGKHNDLFEIDEAFKSLCLLLQQAGSKVEGVFMNANAGFDSKQLRKQCAEKKIEANIAINKRSS